ncbi:MAG: geranylgeranylglycerol-phosphate geranylgeranyltransferase [Saprospiraceae bacterium]|nr:geranylgeranylglycerol-phosphate geranylgeranyltransferase [Saprospiraceae bacterium]
MLRLTRPLNALIVFAALMVARIILLRYLDIHHIEPTVGWMDYLWMIFAGMLILGAGNVINDMLDYEIDLINKPDRTLIPLYVSLRQAQILYFFLNTVAFLISVYLVVKYYEWSSLLIPVLAMLMLYFYSKYLKKSFFWGNFIIALLCGAITLVGFWVEKTNIRLLSTSFPKDYLQLTYAFWCIGVFCFLLVLNRELIKDCEDVEGDLQQGAKTIPIKLGLAVSNRIIRFYFMLYGLLFLALNGLRLKENMSSNILIAIIIYIIIYIIGLWWTYRKYKGKELYAKLSSLVKIFLILGLLFMLV